MLEIHCIISCLSRISQSNNYKLRCFSVSCSHQWRQPPTGTTDSSKITNSSNGIRLMSKVLRLLPRTTFKRNLTSDNNMTRIKTFVFLDLETTGLPHLEHNSTKITELSAAAVQASHIELGCFPRVLNKLSLCLNPKKLIQPDTTNLTGLSNDLLEHQTHFSSDVVDLIKNWLMMNRKPICFVAHNGNRFDYPILRTEVLKTGNDLPEDVLCIDSLEAFKCLESTSTQELPPTETAPFEFNDDFDELLSQACDSVEETKPKTPEEVQRANETTPKKQKITSQMVSDRGIIRKKPNARRSFTSFKLGEVYKRLTGRDPVNAHEAENDVLMLITCAATYGERFIEYANQEHKKFEDVPPMKLGKRLGS